MTPTDPPAAVPGARRLAFPEFVALLAMLFATIAYSIDAMLPALVEIASDLSPGAVNRAQLVVTIFVLGMGLGTLFWGPISDSFGRKSIVVFGIALYAAAALVAAREQAARDRGIRATPTFILGGTHALPGAQPPELWREVLAELADQAP